MHLKGKEKHFWKNNFNIRSLAEIPSEINDFKSIDSELDDDFLFYLTCRIPVIHCLYFKFTNITDEGVKHISKIEKIEELTLREHKNITNASIPFINKLSYLEYLDILKTEIVLEDIQGLYNLQNLKELHISSENIEEGYLLSVIVKIKDILPKCTLYVNYVKFE